MLISEVWIDREIVLLGALSDSTLFAKNNLLIPEKEKNLTKTQFKI